MVPVYLFVEAKCYANININHSWVGWAAMGFDIIAVIAAIAVSALAYNGVITYEPQLLMHSFNAVAIGICALHIGVIIGVIVQESSQKQNLGSSKS